MKVVRSLKTYTERKASAVTVGTFDGVHIGHRAILDAVLDHGRHKGLQSVVITFEPHPRIIVGRGPVQLLTTLDERLDLFRQLHIETVCVIDFTYEFSRMSPEDFFSEYVVTGFNAKEMIIGHDHMFGRDRTAGVETLERLSEKYGISATVVGPVMLSQQTVSSSLVREMLMRGEIDQVRSCLLRPYSLRGRVVRGDGRGAGLGFPTANLQIVDENKLVPFNGVYVVTVEIGLSSYYGMMNIGIRPTFNNRNENVLEVHIFDYQGVLYDQLIRVGFLRRLRGERKFSSRDELISQLERDRMESMTIIAELQTTTVN